MPQQLKFIINPSELGIFINQDAENIPQSHQANNSTFREPPSQVLINLKATKQNLKPNNHPNKSNLQNNIEININIHNSTNYSIYQ